MNTLQQFNKELEDKKAMLDNANATVQEKLAALATCHESNFDMIAKNAKNWRKHAAELEQQIDKLEQQIANLPVQVKRQLWTSCHLGNTAKFLSEDTLYLHDLTPSWSKAYLASKQPENNLDSLYFRIDADKLESKLGHYITAGNIQSDVWHHVDFSGMLNVINLKKALVKEASSFVADVVVRLDNPVHDDLDFNTSTPQAWFNRYGKPKMPVRFIKHDEDISNFVWQ